MATTQDDAPDDVRLHQSHRVLSQAYKADSLRHQGSATRITTDDVKEGLKAAEVCCQLIMFVGLQTKH